MICSSCFSGYLEIPRNEKQIEAQIATLEMDLTICGWQDANKGIPSRTRRLIRFRTGRIGRMNGETTRNRHMAGLIDCISEGSIESADGAGITV